MRSTPAFLFDLDGTLIDSVYQHVLAWREALTEVFSTVAVAQAAGCVISGWDGAPLVFRPDIHALHTVVCSANPRLHAEVLRALEGVAPPGGIPA